MYLRTNHSRKHQIHKLPNQISIRAKSRCRIERNPIAAEVNQQKREIGLKDSRGLASRKREQRPNTPLQRPYCCWCADTTPHSCDNPKQHAITPVCHHKNLGPGADIISARMGYDYALV